MENLKIKLFIEGKILLKTGLHIGGSSTALDVGGIDNNIIKTPAGVPYIPGSSLKGKLRTLYALQEGYASIEDEDDELIKIFGIGAREQRTNPNNEYKISRLIVRDAFLDINDFNRKKEDDFSELELEYTEGKWENTITRTTAMANPRQIERVPAGAKFIFNLVYNILGEQDIKNLNILFTSMRYLQDDYIGGNGTRGYGQMIFQNMTVKYKTRKDYIGNNDVHACNEKIVMTGDNDKLLKELKEKLYYET